MSRLRGLALLLTVSLTLTGCTLSEPEQPSASPTATDSGPSQAILNRRAIISLLEARADAVRLGKRKAYARTNLKGNQARAIMERYDALAALPLGSFDIAFGTFTQGSGDDTDKVSFSADFRVKLKGFDRAAVESGHTMTAVRRGKRWLISADEVTALRPHASPWEMPGAKMVVGRNVLVFGTAASQDSLAGWRDSADLAADYVKAAVPYRWSGRVVVTLPRTNRPFRQAGWEVEQLGGIALEVEPAAGGPSWLRVMIPPKQVASDASARGELLRHEFAHVALGARDDEAPLWLSEGIAEWIGYQKERRYLYGDFARQWYPDGSAQRVIADEKFHRGDWGRSYATAYFYVLWLSNKHGSEAPWRLLKEFQKHPGGPRVEARRMEKLFELTPNEMAQQATAWMLADTI